MVKLFHLFKKYYLPAFLLFIVVMVIFFYVNDLWNKSIADLKIYLIITILGPIVFGSLSLVNNKYYKPWRVKRHMKESPIKEFIERGFIFKDEMTLMGNIKGYTVVIDSFWYEHSRSSTIRYQILFNPKNDHHRFLFQGEYEEIEKELRKTKKYLTMSSIARDYHWDYFLNPSHNEIYNDICLSIEFMKKNELKPIEFNDVKQMSTEIDSYRRTLQNFSY